MSEKEFNRPPQYVPKEMEAGLPPKEERDIRKEFDEKTQYLRELDKELTRLKEKVSSESASTKESIEQWIEEMQNEYISKLENKINEIKSQIQREFGND